MGNPSFVGQRIMGLCAAALTSLVVLAGPCLRAQDRPTVVISDSLGRRVEMPGRARRIISLEPEITRIIVALGGGDRLVGIDYFLRYQDHLFPLVFPGGGRLPVVSNRGQDLNSELAVGLRPDVVFSSPSEFQSAEAIRQKVRVPVAALASGGKFGNLLEEMEILGRVLGLEERARVLVDYFRSRISSMQKEVESFSARERPRVYLSFWGSLLRTPMSYDPVEAAGGVNCAGGLLPHYLGASGTTVAVEQILRWNPEVILVQGNYSPGERAVTVERILGDSRLSSLRAVRSRKVYYTFGFWYWWDPALVLVETLYLARLFHPGRFPEFDLEREGDEIFKRFYGVEGAFTALDKILDVRGWVND
jgi:iron complex transport system substrate-binding protein